jgi:hypothetical protein
MVKIDFFSKPSQFGMFSRNCPKLGSKNSSWIYKGKIAKMLLDEANVFSCATTDVLAFKMLYLTSFF